MNVLLKDQYLNQNFTYTKKEPFSQTETEQIKRPEDNIDYDDYIDTGKTCMIIHLS
jgi:hypothetical protein